MPCILWSWIKIERKKYFVHTSYKSTPDGADTIYSSRLLKQNRHGTMPHRSPPRPKRLAKPNLIHANVEVKPNHIFLRGKIKPTLAPLRTNDAAAASDGWPQVRLSLASSPVSVIIRPHPRTLPELSSPLLHASQPSPEPRSTIPSAACRATTRYSPRNPPPVDTTAPTRLAISALTTGSGAQPWYKPYAATRCATTMPESAAKAMPKQVMVEVSRVGVGGRSVGE